MDYYTLYQDFFTKLCQSGLSASDAFISITHRYLDGLPARKGKRKLNKNDRNSAFWKSPFWSEVADDYFATEIFPIALTRYLQQDQVTQKDLLQSILDRSPNSLCQAVKYSQIFLSPDHIRWQEICSLNMNQNMKFAAFIKRCEEIQQEQSRLYCEVKVFEDELEQISPLDVLVYASLYAFKHIIFPSGGQAKLEWNLDSEVFEKNKNAIEKILLWKLKNCDDNFFNLTEQKIAKSLKNHMVPFLFSDDVPSKQKAQSELFLRIFEQLVSAHLKLNEFSTNVVDWFCFSEGYNFDGEKPEQSQWALNGKKLKALHIYWFHRALDEFITSGLAKQSFGLPENDEWNRWAHIKAIRTNIELQEIFGLNDEITVSNGIKIELFRILLSVELMSVFYQNDFILPFFRYYEQTGSWQSALRDLAMDGLANGMQNRFPITFAERHEKAKALRGWTCSEKWPQGNQKKAEKLLEFWTNDLKSLAILLRSPIGRPFPEFHERPVLKIGRYLFTLPWMMCTQNNSTAAINNLRRLGNYRKERLSETHRIELRLASAFEEHDFQVMSNFEFPTNDMKHVGEIDLICFRDDHLFVFEIKSTYLRKTLHEAWFHQTNTLRKAGQQLKRKREAIIYAIENKIMFEKKFKLDKFSCRQNIHSWIIDTSIEYDHQYFSTFLKVSLQEILIALRNERHLLKNSESFFHSIQEEMFNKKRIISDDLYPNGFSAGRFAQIIEKGEVWDVIDN